jgi:hypothetical protein
MGRSMTTGNDRTVSRARYLVGHDAHIIAAAQPLIPAVFREGITRLVTGL